MSDQTQAIILSGFMAGTVQAAQDFALAKQAVIDKCKAVTNTDTPEGMKAARDAVVEMKAFRAHIESRRVEVKAPVLNKGREIDEFAKALQEGLDAPLSRVESMIKAQLKAEAEASEKARKEREAEQARIDAERRKAEAEAQRLRDEAAKAAAAGDTAKAEKIEEEAFEKALVAEEIAMTPHIAAPVAVVTKGVSAKPKLDYEVQGETEAERVKSILSLAAKYPRFVNVEIRRAQLLDGLNREGLRDLPGITIKEDLRVTIR